MVFLSIILSLLLFPAAVDAANACVLPGHEDREKKKKQIEQKAEECIMHHASYHFNSSATRKAARTLTE